MKSLKYSPQILYQKSLFLAIFFCETQVDINPTGYPLTSIIPVSLGKTISSRLAAGLGVSTPNVTSYIGLLCDLLLMRHLPPFHANIDKRLVKSSKTYVRDSGLVYTLLDIKSFDELLGYPVVGTSWKGFVIENLLSVAPERTQASFYRTTRGAKNKK